MSMFFLLTASQHNLFITGTNISYHGSLPLLYPPLTSFAAKKPQAPIYVRPAPPKCRLRDHASDENQTSLECVKRIYILYVHPEQDSNSGETSDIITYLEGENMSMQTIARGLR